MKKIYWFLLSVLWALLTLRLTTTPNLVVAPETWLNTLIMDGSHFGFFGVEAALLYFAFPTSSKLRAASSVILVSIFGYWIEVLQKSIPGRTYDLMDWALDTLGAIIFILFLNWYNNRVSKHWRFEK